MGKHDLDSQQLCTYLLVKDGRPACFFKIAEAQPCGYFINMRCCYYRGGPFNTGKTGQTDDKRPGKEAK